MRCSRVRASLIRVPVRIGLMNLPELLNEVVRSQFEPGEAEFVELDAGARADSPRVRRLPTVELHVVVAGVRGPWEPDVLALATAHPRTVVLGVRTDGRQSWLYELLPHPRALGELGPTELRATLLAAVQIPVT